MAEYLQTEYEIIPKGDNPIVNAQYVQCADDRLDEVLRSIGNDTETADGRISANETNIATNTSAISGLDSRVTILEEQGGGGTSDYTALTNKPKINGNELTGNKTSSQLGLASESDIPSKVSQLTNDSGFTTNAGTVTSVAVKMNGSTKGTVTSSGTIDLGTVITAHQDISGKVNTSDMLDNGACKNIVNLRSPTTVKNTTVVFDATGSATFKSGGTWTQYIVDFPTVINKKYILYLKVESTNTTSGRLYLRKSGEYFNYYDIELNSLGEKTKEFTPTETVTRICIYSNNSATSRTDSVKLKLMVCDASLSDTSYKQYIPSNEDLYLMILGLK